MTQPVDSPRFPPLAHPADGRNPWGWFAQLVRRFAQPSSASEQRPGDRPHDAALDHALGQLGWSITAIRDAVAAALALPSNAVPNPTVDDLRQVDRQALAVLLPVLWRHNDADVRTWVNHWLSLPEVLDAMPIAALETWLREGNHLPPLVLQHLHDRGLSWLGPLPLARLQVEAQDANVRALCSAWCRGFAVLPAPTRWV